MTILIFFLLGLILYLLCLALNLPLSKTDKKKENPTNDRSCVAGTMVINTTDPKKDIIRFELDIPISEMFEKDRVTFVVTMEDESQ